MASLPQIPRRLSLVEAPTTRNMSTPTDAGAPYKLLADGLDKLGQGLEEASIPLAEQAGYKAVTRDEAGNIQVDRAPIIGKAAVAYSRAVKVAALADGEGVVKRDAIELRTQFRNDPDGYLKAATAYRDEKVKSYTDAAGPEVGLALGRSIDSTVTETYRGLLNEKERLDLHRASDSIQTRIATLENEAAALARGGDTSSETYRRTVASVADLRRELSQNPRLNYTPERAKFDGDKFNTSLRISALANSIAGQGGVFDKQGYEAAIRAAETIRTDPKLNLSAEERYAAFNRVVGEINQRRSVAQAGIRAQVGEMAAIEKIADSGIAVPPAQLAQVRAGVAASGDPDLQARMERTEAVLRFTEGARQMTPAQIAASIGSLDQTMADRPPSEILAVKTAGVRLFSTMQKALKENPLAWADQVGLQKIPALDFGNPQSLRERVARAETVAAHYGVQPTYLLPQESQALETAVAQGGAQMLTAAKVIADGFGDRAPLVASEVSRQSPVLAHMGALLSSGGSPAFVSDVAEAVKLRNDKDFKLPRWLDKPTDKQLKAQGDRARDVYGSAFVTAPDSQRAAEATAQSAFFTRAARRGHDPLLENSDSKAAFDRSLQEAAGARFTSDGVQYGGIGTVGGWFSFSGRNAAKVLVPANVRADRFSQVIGAVTDADLTALPVPPQSADGRAFTARDLQSATPVATRGGYRFALGDPTSADPKWIRGADGNPFTLDMTALEPALRQRVPGAYLGAK